MRTNYLLPLLIALGMHIPFLIIILQNTSNHHLPSSAPLKRYAKSEIQITKFSEKTSSTSSVLTKSIKPTISVDLSMESSINPEDTPTLSQRKIETTISFDYSPEPVYPIQARKKEITGIVRVQVNYTASGDIENVMILDSSGSSLLDNSVKSALMKWKVAKNSISTGGMFIKIFEFKLK